MSDPFLPDLDRRGRSGSFYAFVFWAMIIFAMTLSVMHSIGFVPYYIDGTNPDGTPVSPAATTPSSDTITTYSTETIAPVPTVTAVVPTPMPTPVAVPVAATSTPVSATVMVPATTSYASMFTAPTLSSLAFPERIVIPVIGLNLPIQNIASRDLEVLDKALAKGPIRYTDSAVLGEQGNILIFAHSSNLPVVHNQMYKAFNKLKNLKAGNEITIDGGGKHYIYSVISVRETNAEDEVIDLSPKQGTHLTLSTCDTLTSKSARYVVDATLKTVISD